MNTIINSIRDAAAAVRGRRKDLGLSQADLARLSGASRKWVGEFEAGKATAELGLVLRVLDALGLNLEIRTTRRELPSEADLPAAAGGKVDLDALLDEYRDDS